MVAGALNLKLQHCVAWFTTSSSSYVTIEITHGRYEGVVREKTQYGKNFVNNKLQLIVRYWNGSLGGDTDKVDWRKKYTKRKKSIDDIIEYAKDIFDVWDYHLTLRNC